MRYKVTATAVPHDIYIGSCSGVSLEQFDIVFECSGYPTAGHNTSAYSVSEVESAFKSFFTGVTDYYYKESYLGMVEHDVRETTFSSGAEWHAAKESGAIKTAPMLLQRGMAEDRVIGVTPGKVVASNLITVDAQDWLDSDLECRPFLGAGYVSWGAHPRAYNIRYTVEQLPVQHTAFNSYGPPPLALIADWLCDMSSYPQAIHNSALADVRSGVYDLGVELAELAETRKFVLTTLKQTLNLWRKAKTGTLFGEVRRYALDSKGRLRKGRKTQNAFIPKDKRQAVQDALSGTDKLAGNWMAFRYAATPLVHSIADIASYVSNPVPKFITARKRRDVTVEKDFGSYRVSATVSYRAWAKARLNHKPRHVGLALNPAASLWEVTPGAFVVDWVFPVGDLLMGAIPPDWEDEMVVMHSVQCRDVKITAPTEHGYINISNTLGVYKAVNAGTMPCFEGLFPKPNIKGKRLYDALALAWFSTSRRL